MYNCNLQFLNFHVYDIKLILFSLRARTLRLSTMNSRQMRDLTVAATLAIIGNQIFCLLFVSNNLLIILPPQHLNYYKVKLGIWL